MNARDDGGRSGPVDVLLGSVAAVSWALVGMAAVAALGLHLLDADASASLGPMTAALVVLGAGGSVTPSGDVSAFGLEGVEARTAVDFTPLGVGLTGALILGLLFLRSLRRAGAHVSVAELALRAGTVAALFVGLVGGLAWAGRDVITIDGSGLGLSQVPGLGGDGSGSGGTGIPGLGEVPGLGDLGDIPGVGGLLPDRLGDLADVQATVGFRVDIAGSLAGALLWVFGVLAVALLVSGRAPLPRGWDRAHRIVRPAASALVGVVLMAVLAGLAAATYAAIGDDHPRRIAGAALLAAPNGVWLGIPLGLFVPWDGRASGALATLLPDPLDRLLRPSGGEPLTVGGLAELDGRIWLLVVAVTVMMLYAGVLTAVRTVRADEVAADGSGPAHGSRTYRSLGAFVWRCALRLGIVTALTLPALVWLTDVSADASLSVFGIPAFGAGIELHGRAGTALLLGAVWGAGAGGAGALLAYAAGWGRRTEAAGEAATETAEPQARWAPRTEVLPLPEPAFPPMPEDAPSAGPARTDSAPGQTPGPYRPSVPYRPADPDTNPYLRLPEGESGPSAPGSQRDGR
ncbi:streptophobe family protein [Streptomyces sp. NPDC059479]|uniref:streptophobe family protein n=1 Tax=Streptomyces sp. NPDC059479 TaxID=3346848 RepID=UPI0036B78BF9